MDQKIVLYGKMLCNNCINSHRIISRFQDCPKNILNIFQIFSNSFIVVFWGVESSFRFV